MWVQVERITRFRIIGHLVNHPLDFPRLEYGSQIKFRRKHIIDIDSEVLRLADHDAGSDRPETAAVDPEDDAAGAPAA
jgi:hypothetical protein